MSISDAFYNNWGLATSIIGILVAIYKWYYSRLLEPKLSALDGLLDDTRKLFFTAIGDGTLEDDKTIDGIQRLIWK